MITTTVESSYSERRIAICHARTMHTKVKYVRFPCTGTTTMSLIVVRQLPKPPLDAKPKPPPPLAATPSVGAPPKVGAKPPVPTAPRPGVGAPKPRVGGSAKPPSVGGQMDLAAAVSHLYFSAYFPLKMELMSHTIAGQACTTHRRRRVNGLARRWNDFVAFFLSLEFTCTKRPL